MIGVMVARLGAVVLLIALISGSGAAEDVRDATRRAAADREAAARAAAETEAAILADRARLTAEVERLEAEKARLEHEVDGLRGRIDDLSGERDGLAETWSRRELAFREISGNARVAARDLETLLRQSLLSAASPERLDRLTPILDEGYFPDIDDISVIARLFLDEMIASGEVRRVESAPFIDRRGEPATGTVLTLGPFIAAYRSEGETGFLRYSPEERTFVALPALPDRGSRRQINRYLEGRTASVPIDLSGGAALRQIIDRVSLGDQLRAGGPLIWPILAIALFALVIVVERFIFLHGVRSNTDRIMGAVNDLAARGDWSAAEELLRRHEKRSSPVIRVLATGLGGRGEGRETLEGILEEAILRELPRLERFLSVLATLGTVAPLLGLLGTVTGMIDTFRVITLHGAGDPKLMSGGISEALITTELGLAVAIPIMLVHVVLSRRVNHLVADMEEKAVGLTNIIHKEQLRDGDV